MLPRNTLDWVFFEKSAQQVREKSTCIRNGLVWSRLNLSDELLQATCLEGRQACGHLVKYAAKRPQVRLITVDTLVIEQLRSHVVRSSVFPLRASFCVLIWLLASISSIFSEVGKFARKSKVAKLESAVLVDKYIRRLQVTVDDSVEVQVVETLGQVSTKLLDRLLGQLFVLFNQLKQVATGTVLKNDPKMVSGLIPIVELENVSVLQVVEDSNLQTNNQSCISFNFKDYDMQDASY